MKIFAAAVAVTAACTALTLPAHAAHHETITQADAARIVDSSGRSDADTALDDSRMPARTLAFMGIARGDRVLDMLAGGGYYTELLARAVGPEGFVIAQNPAAFASRDAIREALAVRDYGSRLKNVAAMNVDFMNMGLAPNSIDNVLFHLAYHDLYFESTEFGLPRTDPQVVLARLHKALKPGATITVIDHVGDGADARADVEAAHRISPFIVKRDFEQAGFKLVAEETFFDSPDDDHAKSVFDPALRGRTDRFAMRFAKAGDPNSGAEVTMTEDVPEFGAGDCNADPIMTMVGASLDGDMRVAALRESGARTLRVYETGQPVTMDYRTDRLNIETDPETGRILRVSCG